MLWKFLQVNFQPCSTDYLNSGAIRPAGLLFTVKMTHLPIHHHGDYRISPIVFTLSEHVAMYDNMPPGGCFYKHKQIV